MAFKLEQEPKQDEPKQPKVLRCIAPSGVNVRMDPSRDSDIVRVIANGEAIHPKAQTNGWYQLEDGHVMVDYFE